MPRKTRSAIALCLCIAFLSQATLPYEKNDDLVQNLIYALNRVLDFYHRDVMSVNLDGIFGLRVAQGAFLSLLHDVQGGQLSLEDSVLRQVRGLYNKATIIGQDSLPFLMKSEPEYFKKFKKEVSNPWINFKPFTNKKLQKRHYGPQERRNVISFDETQSDKCMVEITGTGTSVNAGQPCQVSDECWRLISSEGATGYTLTHQALFLLLGEIQGCTPILSKRLEQSNIKGGLEQVYNRICSDMYPEMIAREHKGQSNKISVVNRDLYMEQAMVCGSIGYQQFLSHERLKAILTWQRKDGCFSQQEPGNEDDNNYYYKEFDGNDQSKEVTDDIKKEGDSFDDVTPSLGDEYSKKLRRPLSVNKRTMRSLLVEKELNDGCLSHLTGVATGLLGLYLRWLPYARGQQPVQNLAINKKMQDNEPSTDPEVYKNGNLGDFIAQQERQLQLLKQDVSQTAHLRPMRRAAMLDSGAREVLLREPSGSFPWGVAVLCVCSLFLVFSVVFLKGIKKTLYTVEAAVTGTKKRTHII